MPRHDITVLLWHQNTPWNADVGSGDIGECEPAGTGTGPDGIAPAASRTGSADVLVESPLWRLDARQHRRDTSCAAPALM